eukprot:TRINITY_DN12124_c3_g1_i1.p1 TRINITY_DN12124_c3_g1~~TRINITY_DN12124_c3_g1_i1.p1  ORF type:complete len:175 (-),score=1.39 TRINITY_DN12124_c3_g1_i1:166-690(-)
MYITGRYLWFFKKLIQNMGITPGSYLYHQYVHMYFHFPEQASMHYYFIFSAQKRNQAGLVDAPVHISNQGLPRALYHPANRELSHSHLDREKTVLLRSQYPAFCIILVQDSCRCPMCLRNEETVHHLLINSPFAPRVWSAVIKLFYMDQVMPRTVEDLFLQWQLGSKFVRSFGN